MSVATSRPLPLKLFATVFVVVWLVIAAFPFLWTVWGSFKVQADFFSRESFWNAIWGVATQQQTGSERYSDRRSAVFLFLVLCFEVVVQALLEDTDPILSENVVLIYLEEHGWFFPGSRIHPVVRDVYPGVWEIVHRVTGFVHLVMSL